MIYSIIDENNTYDYDDDLTTTDDIEQAYEWIRNGIKEVAVLDCCLALVYVMDFEDLPEFKETQQ